jgi:hypothetical protein
MVFVQTGDPFVDWLSNAGAIAILAFFVVAFLRGWIVTGAYANEIREQRDKALQLVYKQAEIAQRALEVSENKK